MKVSSKLLVIDGELWRLPIDQHKDPGGSLHTLKERNSKSSEIAKWSLSLLLAAHTPLPKCKSWPLPHISGEFHLSHDLRTLAPSIHEIQHQGRENAIEIQRILTALRS